MSAINYHRAGSGPALVLLHGVGHHWQAWRPVIDQLASEFEVIACDSPGFGRSPPLPAGVAPTVGAYAEALARFLTELALDRPHVAGNSMGGAIALELARRRSVRSATALSPAGFWTPAERRYCQRSLGLLARFPSAFRPTLLALARTRPGRVALFSQILGSPAWMPAEEAVATLRDAWAAPAFADALAAFDAYTFRDGDELRGIPVTIAWGRHDRLLLHGRQAPRARALLPWARHVTLRAGHVPFFDDPGAVAEGIRATAAEASLDGSPGEGDDASGGGGP
jgi:pimeloyl-ACP methyl ester carboxylesterase